MNIPPCFKEAIANVFYDKTVSVCSLVTRTDSFGAIIKDGYSVKSTFKASVQSASSAVMVEEFGHEVDATKRIACDLSNGPIDETDDFILYDGSYYEITGVLPTDTSLIVMVKEVNR